MPDAHPALKRNLPMRTTMVLVFLLGLAASICTKHRCDPRGVYTDRLDELKQLMTKGVGR